MLLNLRTLVVAFIALGMLCQVSQASGQDSTLGTYSLTFYFDDIDTKAGQVTARVVIDAAFPSSPSYALIPVPFSLDEVKDLVVEPHSEYFTILHGDIRPERKFGVMFVDLRPNSASMQLVIHGAEFFLERTDQVQSGQSVHLLLRRAYTATRENFPEASIPTLTHVRVKSNSLEETFPQSPRTDLSASERVIRFQDGSPPTSDIVVYFREPGSSLYPLYGVLGAIGLFSGFIPYLFFTPSVRRAKWSLGLSLGMLVVLVSVFLLVLDSDQRLHDSTTVVTFGLGFGSLFGLIGVSLYTLSQTAARRYGSAAGVVGGHVAGRGPAGPVH